MIHWLFDVFAWLLESFGGSSRLQGTRLALPTHEFFPVSSRDPRERAQQVFDLVKEHAGMSRWPCRLEFWREPSIAEILDGMPHDGTESKGTAGSIFAREGTKEIVITCNENNLESPMDLVATLAHEFGHYLLFTATTPVPGGDEMHEPATDVSAVFMGFGVFLANSAFSFQQLDRGALQGWSARRRGYLGEVELSYALAIFACAKALPIKEIRIRLDTNPRSYIKKAAKDIEKRRRADITRLQRIDEKVPQARSD
jgi:hypothetical protein